MEFITKLKLEDKVVVTDPCYCYEPNQRGIVLLENVQAGDYKCCVLYNKENRVKEAIILHESLSIYEQEGFLWLQEGFIKVDAAIAGVINYSLHEEMRRCKNRNEKKWEDKYYKEICELSSKDETFIFKDNSFITSTGWGDGRYEVYVTKNDDKILGIKIIYDEDEEEFEDDWEDEEEY